ncbi:unnamed protein product, partial [Ectocarpus sp. 12 AP-2014]
GGGLGCHLSAGDGAIELVCFVLTLKRNKQKEERGQCSRSEDARNGSGRRGVEGRSGMKPAIACNQLPTHTIDQIAIDPHRLFRSQITKIFSYRSICTCF